MPELHLSCSLVSIARGQCQLTLSGIDRDGDTEIGNLLIEVNRPIMRGAARIPTALFASIRERLAATPPRPISLTLQLDAQLAVSIEGDLRIDEEKTICIRDMAVTLPLK